MLLVDLGYFHQRETPWGKAFFQLQDMDHRMDLTGVWQLQFVSHLTNFLKNQIRTKALKAKLLPSPHSDS